MPIAVENITAMISAAGDTSIVQPEQPANPIDAKTPKTIPVRTSQHTDEHGFEEELHLDVRFCRTDRHADTDLTGALGDGDKHDVHNANTTHQ